MCGGGVKFWLTIILCPGRYSDGADTSASAQKLYGVGSVQPPLPRDEVQQLCAEFKSAIAVTKEEALRSERETVKQGDDPDGLWLSLRRPRLTLSNFGAVCRCRKSTPVANMVKSLLYNSISSNVRSLHWGRENEANARQSYIEEMARRGTPVATKSSGLVISTSNSCLACSPDGMVEDKGSTGTVEFKCPYSARDITPVEACATKGFYCALKDGKLELKQTHKYYYQVQGVMAITDTKWCDFVVWTPKGVSIQRIMYDHTFWTDQMLPKLLGFYDTALLPELAAPEHPNGRPIREPGTW